MKKIFSIVIVLTLAGCVTQATLVAQDGPRYKLDVDPVMKKLKTVIDGVEYKGSFVKDSGIGFGQSFGQPGYSTSTLAMAGSNGQAVMTSAQGGYIECSFNASGMTVVGKCQSNVGRQFVLTTD